MRSRGTAVEDAVQLLKPLEDTKDSLRWPAVMTAVGLLLLWPPNLLAPRQGLDPSHGAAMAMASQKGLRFGVQILFTYGPLGFLHVPTLYFGRTALLSELFILLLEAGLFFVLARSAMRAFGPVLGILAFGFVASATAFELIGGFLPELGTLLVALLAIEWVNARRPELRLDLRAGIVPAALADFSVVLLLIKFSAGVLGLLVVGLACLLRELPDGDATEALGQRVRTVAATAAMGL